VGNRIELIRSELHRLHRQQELTASRQRKTSNKIRATDIIQGKAGSVDMTEEKLFTDLNYSELLEQIRDLELFYTSSTNRYQKIRAAMFLSRLYGYYLPNRGKLISIGTVPYQAVKAIEARDFDEALDILNAATPSSGESSEALMKILSLAYSGKGFKLIEEQVRECIAVRNPQLFNLSSIGGYHLRNPNFYANETEEVQMPVRIEHTSCVGSDIFYLAMDRPAKARCINISVNLYDSETRSTAPPISVIIRPIKEEGIRLTSMDLGCSKLVTNLEDMFNMRNDDLSLLKAAVIASGIVPPALKGREKDIPLLLAMKEFMQDNNQFAGFEVISNVINIPRGSGLAVSTNLLAGLILALLRFSGQGHSGSHNIGEQEKEVVAARCTYAEWIGGSGGGWQDYGGMWGGFKRILGQPANSALDPDSKGALLPKYEELFIHDSMIEEILSSLVLANGGTGQDVGPVLKMITEQYVLRSSVAWQARQRTERRYDAIFAALISGNIRRLGRLESEDFADRRLIAPLSNNAYHERVYKNLQNTFKEDLWGYDSTGGRAGAGGIFFVAPSVRKGFENAFVQCSLQVQYELAGQMHFNSTPGIYHFEINQKGAQATTYERHAADALIDNWGQRQRARSEKMELNTNQETIEKIKQTCGFDKAGFLETQNQYKGGLLSISGNIKAERAKIEQIDSENENSPLTIMPLIGTTEYNDLFDEGISLLKETPLAYVILNGGESTRFGTHVIRGLNPVFFMGGKYRSSIELKMANVSFIRARHGATVLPVFVNGFFTHSNTMRVLRTNGYYGIPETDIYSCVHPVTHRVNPRTEDLTYWFDILRDREATEVGEELAGQYNQAMKEWAFEAGEGEIYRPIGMNATNTLVSPGHFYSFMSLVSNFTLGNLIEREVKRLLVSSNDNLLATIDPSILALHAKKRRNATVEVVPRLFDRGGAPVIIDGKVVILEDFCFPGQETLWATPYFNPITSWIEIEKLLGLVGITETEMVAAAFGDPAEQQRCQEAVSALSRKVPTYTVLKHMTEDMGDGIKYPFPVIQFEKVYGDLAGLLEPTFLLVPKLLRHTQMKSVDHVYQIAIDRSLEVLEPQVALSRER